MIPKRALGDVLTALGDALFAEPHGILATDADGTLWSGDVGIDAFHVLLTRGLLHDDALGVLLEEARAYGVSDALAPTEQARQLFEAEQRGDYPGDRACAMMAWIYAGLSAAEMRTFAREVVATHNLPGRLQPEAMAVLRWASERSVPVVVVSASPLAVVEAAVDFLPGPRPHVIAMRPCEERGRLLPRVATPLPYGPGKAKAIRATYGDRPVLAAMGDSGFDAEMLKLARFPLAVRPKESLRRSHEDIAELAELTA